MMPQGTETNERAALLAENIATQLARGRTLEQACLPIARKLDDALPAPDVERDVLDFMKQMDQDICRIGDSPPQMGSGTALLRARLIKEETDETIEALASGDLAKLARELVDVVYVAIGTAHAYGIPFYPAWDLVHQANMAKRDKETGKAVSDERGKVVKPEGWAPPDLSRLFPCNHDHLTATEAAAPVSVAVSPEPPTGASR